MSDENLVAAADRLKSQRDFTRIPNEIIQNPALSAGAKEIWSILWSHCYQGDASFPGMERVSEMMGVTERTAYKYRREIEKAGLLETERRGEGKTNVYKLYCPDPKELSTLDRKGFSTLDRKELSDKEDEVSTKEDKDNNNNGKSEDLPPPDPNQIKRYWNKKMPEPIQIGQMSRKRKRKLKARRKEPYFSENWKKLVDKASNSSFLTEEWSNFDFTWTVKNDDNYTKILEGKYDDVDDDQNELYDEWKAGLA